MNIECIVVNDEFNTGFRCFRPTGLRNWNLFVMFKTPAYVRQGNDYILVEPGNYCIFKNGAYTEYYSKGAYFNHDFFHFEYNEKDESMFFNGLEFNAISKVRNQNEVSAILEIMKKEMSPDGICNRLALSELAHYFFVKLREFSISDECDPKDDERYNNLLILRKKIWNNPEKDWKADDVAQNMYISEYYFLHLYKKEFGTSFRNDIIDARIAKAKNLLIYSQCKISDISNKCGYMNVEHFSRLFKKKAGVSPYSYRKTEIIR